MKMMKFFYGQVVRFNSELVRPMGRTAAGVRGIRLRDKEELIDITSSNAGEFLLSIGVNGVGKLTPISEYRMTNRGTGGTKTIKVTNKTGSLAATKAVNQTDEVLIITNKNKVIRFSVDEIREAGRNTQGVKLVNLDNGDKVRDIAIFKRELMSEEETSTPKASTTNEQNVTE